MRYWRSIAISALLILAITTMAFAYQQAPMFNALVAQGKLPPVAQRLPDNPLVVTPLHIGQYGGTANVYTDSQFWLWSGEMVGMEWILGINSDYSWGTPNIIQSYDLNSTATVLTLHLRKGLKWSDGVAFTSEDFMYNWKYVVNNKDIYPTVPDWMCVDGKPLTMTAPDAYTVVITFPAPDSLFINYLSHAWGEQSWGSWYGIFQPAHYCEQFNPAFIGQDVANQKAKAAGYASWVQWYWANTGLYFGIQDKPYTETAPTLTAYVCVERTPQEAIYERNAYFWKVDSAGNQLPYIDRIDLHFVASSDVIDAKIISGDVDAEWIRASLDKLPLYKANAKAGDYSVRLYTTSAMSDIELNLTDPDPVIRSLFDNLKFREALSVAINRDEINKAADLGLATPRSLTVPKESPYFEPQFATSYINYDPKQAESLLDSIGLDKKGSDGFRLGPDGKPLLLTIEATTATPDLQLIRDYWRAIGLNVDLKVESQDLLNQRVAANQTEIMPGAVEFNIEPAFSTLPQFYVPLTNTWPGLWGNQWALYYNTGGKQGEKPPAQIQQLYDWYNQIKSAVTPADRIKPAQEILQSMATNLWEIGLLGGMPSVVIVKNDLMNVPETALMTWDICRMYPYKLNTWYFTDRPAIQTPWPGRF